MANRPPPPLSGLQNHQHRDTNSKADELRNGPHSLATSATTTPAHSPPNSSFKSKCSASDPALLVPELCNEFSLPSVSAAKQVQFKKEVAILASVTGPMSKRAATSRRKFVVDSIVEGDAYEVSGADLLMRVGLQGPAIMRSMR